MAVIAPLASHGQDAGSAAPMEVPRAWQTFDQLRGYADLSPDRFGTVADPDPSELGMLLVQRMFRNVCLGFERGETLDAVTPPGFSAYGQGVYLFGDAGNGKGGTHVLSSTGSIALDEDDGHPAIWLRPGESGMTCAIEWTIAETVQPERQLAIAGLLGEWLPYEMSLVRASRPSLAPRPLSDHLEWDRPCFDRWCPTSATYNLSLGQIRLETKLNITDIGGNRP